MRPRRVLRRPVAPTDGDAGAGTVLVIGLTAMVVLLTVAVAVLGRAQATRHQVQAAADLAALAGAAALWAPSGVQVLEPRDDVCELVTEVAERNGGTVRSCDVVRSVVAVEVRRSTSFGPAVARARAGPA